MRQMGKILQQAKQRSKQLSKAVAGHTAGRDNMRMTSLIETRGEEEEWIL